MEQLARGAKLLGQMTRLGSGVSCGVPDLGRSRVYCLMFGIRHGANA